MRLLITGICGFAGSRLAEALIDRFTDIEVVGVDNLSRRGSELNVARLARLGCKVVHGDVRVVDDLAELPRVDWILDCAATPSVLAGLDHGAAQLVGHNLVGTLNLLEKCRRDGAGFIVISSSRVYSIPALAALPLRQTQTRFQLDPDRALPDGFTAAGVTEAFSTRAPISLYGATKLASEVMALEYGLTFGFPVRVNRCGVIAGAGQFGRVDQGVFSYWVYQWLRRQPLAYIGFGGEGRQVRDFIAPGDLARLIALQLERPTHPAPAVLNVGGGLDRALSLRELSEFCRRATATTVEVASKPDTRPFDIPYYVTDASAAARHWSWQPEEPADHTLEGIVRWARDHIDELASFAI